jgi:hypothetical protein
VEDNRVTVTNAIRLESVNGPLVTTIDGGWDGVMLSRIGRRCVYLGTDAVLSGFTLTKGMGLYYGGGVFCESVSSIVADCVLTDNTSGSCTTWSCGGAGGGAYGGKLYNCTLTYNSSFHGGGAYEGMLFNCTLTQNSSFLGGGASRSTLYNCTLTSNWAAQEGGGALGCTLYNCTVTGNSGGGVFGSSSGSSTAFNSIVYYNSGGNYDTNTVLNFCCTTPLPTNGVGNITGPPLFMDFGAGDYRLREESPCIDAGADLSVLNVGYVFEPTDMLGNTVLLQMKTPVCGLSLQTDAVKKAQSYEQDRTTAV